MPDTTNENAATTATASTCSPNRLQPPPKNTPSLPAGFTVASAKRPSKHRTDDAADEVHGDDVERVVVAEPELQRDREVAHDAGDAPR